jgi:hypothetical protein
MAKYVPKVDDIVFMDGKGFVRYVVVDVDSGKQTASLHAPGADGGKTLICNVPWAAIHRLDSSQNALRIVREATEGK